MYINKQQKTVIRQLLELLKLLLIGERENAQTEEERDQLQSIKEDIQTIFKLLNK